MLKVLSLLLFTLTFQLSMAFATPLITNFSKVNEGIYRGARLVDFNSFLYLKSLNIKNIINLQGGDMNSSLRVFIPWAEPGEKATSIVAEKIAADTLSIGFTNIPLNSLDPITNEEDKAIDGILNFMNNQNNWPIYIHCEHGADRTGLLVALYRVKFEGISPIEARNEWIKNGHNKLHQLFTGVLDDYYFEKTK